MNKDLFILELKKINIDITNKQLSQLEKYYELLVEANKNINLTGITEKEEVYLKHFYDCATINKVIDLKNERTFCDIGTGAGFPGIVIKILFPNLNITLVDSLKKRLDFLDTVIKELCLDGITTIHARIEEYGVSHKELYDIVTARAVAPLNILIEYAIPLVRVNKYFIAMKANVKEELYSSSSTLFKLDCSVDKVVEFLLPIEGSTRTLIKIKKLKSTSKIFPRKYIEIKNKQL